MKDDNIFKIKYLTAYLFLNHLHSFYFHKNQLTEKIKKLINNKLNKSKLSLKIENKMK